MPQNTNTGKLIGIYSTSPAAMQRAAVLAFLSFFFFIAMLVLFYIRPQLGYFLLSSTFLVIHLITLTGMWMQKKNTVRIYTEGISYKKVTFFWRDLISAETAAGKDLALTYNDSNEEKTLLIPRSINNFDNLAAFAKSKIANAIPQ